MKKLCHNRVALFLHARHWSITSILNNVLRKYTNIDKFKEEKYKIKDQILQFSQEICPDHSIKTCFIQQNEKNIMNNRDYNLYNEYTHSFNPIL